MGKCWLMTSQHGSLLHIPAQRFARWDMYNNQVSGNYSVMKKRPLDLNLLRSLDALLQEQNVTRAAERLNVTQQAMSGTLARLRDHFDDQILIRVGRQLQPTTLGRSLEKPVREAILRAEIAFETVPHFDPMTTSRVIRIALSDYATLVLLPKLLSRLSREAPNISVRVQNISPDNMRQIEAGEIDMCLTAGDWKLYTKFQPSSEIHSEPVFTDDFVCLVDEKHPQVGDNITREKYLQLHHVATAFGTGAISMVEGAWAAERLAIKVAATSPSFSSQLFMLPNTYLVATVQRKLANILAPTLRLRVLECPISVGTLQEILVWHSRHDDALVHSFIRGLILETAATLD